ncbi:hypothetical protein SAMN04488104_105028 [Algoriphagus faecimaris]|uniref:Outer membrane protein beta-barrel domain-containing protein n=1 Tax=Algoriphagus faecimaris TaxID=686796 RepID=A0A1G6X2D3_9BACT|nr:hypothetical protein [Algoriphagus faecimaris]SDD72258.1 hypothetical protein SAMN04488104_105028 [Algoriphagus faecimaris]
MNIQHKSSLLLVLILAFAISSGATAQTEPGTFTAKKGVYLEVGGSSGFYAINYSKIFHQKGKLKLNASAGFSIWPNRNIDSKTSWLPALPLEISALYGKSNHHLELGMGFTSYLNTSFDFDSETFETINKVVFDAFIPLRVGYRYQKPEGGFFFRFGYTPIVTFPVRAGKIWSFNPYWAGLSFGKSF